MQQAACLFGRQITAGLKGDCAKCTAVTTEKIKGPLTTGEPKDALLSIKWWYKAATDCAPKASKMSLAAQTVERVALYGRVASKTDLIPIHVD